MTRAEARQQFPTSHLYWYGRGHCWNAMTPSRRRVVHRVREHVEREAQRGPAEPNNPEPKLREAMSEMPTANEAPSPSVNWENPGACRFGCLTAFRGRQRARMSCLGQIFFVAEPFDLRADLLSGTGSCRGWSSQDEIDQRDKGHTARGGDQGVVGPRVRILVGRELRGFFGHAAGLGLPRQVRL